MNVPKQEKVISNEERKQGREAGEAVGEAGLAEVKHSTPAQDFSESGGHCECASEE